MSLLATRLDIAVDVARRAFPSGDPDTTDRRLAAFRESYLMLSQIEGDDDEWTEDSLECAWDLVRDARSRGSLHEDILADLAAAHAAVLEAAAAPRADLRRKPRRDA